MALGVVYQCPTCGGPATGTKSNLACDRCRYPQGQLNPDDQGELLIAIAADHVKKVVVLDFGKPVKWIALDARTAQGLAQLIADRVRELL